MRPLPVISLSTPPLDLIAYVPILPTLSPLTKLDGTGKHHSGEVTQTQADKHDTSSLISRR